MSDTAPVLLLTYRPPSPRRLCLNCQKCQRSRPRGLCRSCHEDHAIRQQYPPISPHGRRSPRHHERASTRLPPPSAPTRARPGTAAKIAVLAERVAARVALWHRLDSSLDPESAALGLH